MALQPLTTRFEPAVLNAAKLEARRKGISVNQFVQTAVLTRVAFCYAQRGEAATALSDLYAAAERAVRAGEDY